MKIYEDIIYRGKKTQALWDLLGINPDVLSTNHFICIHYN